MATIHVDASATIQGDGSLANPFQTIGEALAIAMDGDTIAIAGGTYAENVIVDKAVTLDGAVDGTGAPDVIVGTGTGAAITVSAIAPGQNVTLQNLASNSGSNGVAVATTAELAGLTLDNMDISGASGSGFSANDTELVDAISILNSGFTKNALGGSNGTGDIVIFQYNGDVTIQNTTITGADLGTMPRADQAVQVSGFDQSTYDVQGPIGTVNFTDVTVAGTYDKVQVLIQGYSDLAGLSFTNTELTGATGWAILAFIDPIASTGQDIAGNVGYPGNFPGGNTGIDIAVDLSGITANNMETGLGAYMRGTDADDLITGTNADDALNDLAEGMNDFGGDDTVFGGAGDDALIGGDGDDELDGVTCSPEKSCI